MKRRWLWVLVAAAVVLLPSTGAAKRRLPEAGVELNTANLEQLMLLPGIGRKRAEDIVDLRQKQPFRRATDLLRVPGIGRRTFLRLKPFVRVESVEVSAAAPSVPRSGSAIAR